MERKEAMEIVRNLYNKSMFLKKDKEAMVTLIPELKDSEDERIRKKLLSYFSDVKGFSSLEYNYGITREDAIAWLEKQGEQKSADDVKPKFNIGDFVIGVYCTGKIVDVTNDAYLLDTGMGVPFSSEHNIRLWTIQDAKDGDVLVSGQIIILFKKFEEDTDLNFVIAHAGIDISGKVQITNRHWLISNKAKPATKEQRDTLFAKMKEAGYEWDAEKKRIEED